MPHRVVAALGTGVVFSLFALVPTSPAHAAGLANQTPPTITVVGGDPASAPQVGRLLLADPGVWSPSDGTTFTYSWWYADSATATSGAKATVIAGSGSRTARDFVPLHPQVGKYLGVTVTARNGADTATATAITSSPLVGFNPTMKAKPTNTAELTTDLSAAPHATKAFLTAYGWPDNSPPGAVMATSWDEATYPAFGGIHPLAGGTGTYDDPITFATTVVDTDADEPVGAVVPWGTEIWVPKYEKYFIAEDVCYECGVDFGGQGVTASGRLDAGQDGGPALVHFDLWFGGQDDVFADVIDCENQLTQYSDDGTPVLDDVIVNPPPDLVANTKPIWDQANRLCNGEPLQPKAGGTIGQYRSVDPDQAYPGTSYATVGSWTGRGVAGASVTWDLRSDPFKFTVPSTELPRPDGTLCITDPDNSAQAGTWLRLSRCKDPSDYSIADQLMSFSGSFLVFNNLCLDIGDGLGHPDSGAIGWEEQTDRTAPRPVTLQKCNYGTGNQWEVNPNGTITDMQTGWWTLGDLGPSTDEIEQLWGVRYLWAIPIGTVDEGATVSSFWDDPWTRGADDTAVIRVGGPRPAEPLTELAVTVGGLTTPTFQLRLVSADDPDGVLLADNVAADVTQASVSANGPTRRIALGEWRGAVTIPEDTAPGTYQIQVIGLDTAIPDQDLGGTTAVVAESDLQQTKDDAGEVGWSLANFPDPPVNLTITVTGRSDDITVVEPARPSVFPAHGIVLGGLGCVCGGVAIALAVRQRRKRG